MTAPMDPNDPAPGKPDSGSPVPIKSPAPVPAAPNPAPEIVPLADDAGSQALTDALRSSFAIVKIIMVALVVVFLASGVFTVGSQERAVILRFGRPVVGADGPLLLPGLHWAFPYPIDEVVKITNAQIQSITSSVGWYATTPEMEMAGREPDAGASLNPASDGYTLTSDANIIHVRATLQYRVTDPLTYVFKFTNAPAVVQHALDNALVYASAQSTVDDALRRDVEGFKEKIRKRVEHLIEANNLGITLEPLALKTLAPRQLKEDFDKVQNAEQDLSKLKNEAQGYASTNLSAAIGQATARINLGVTSSNQMAQAVAAEAQKFENLLPEYQRNPDFFRNRLLAESLQRVMTNVEYKFYIPTTDGKNSELRLQLNRRPQNPRQRTNDAGVR